MERVFSVLRATLLSAWLFFPALFFPVFAYYAMTTLDQGRDIVTTIVESETIGLFPILAVSFWACLTWYASRHVAIKKKDHIKSVDSDTIWSLEHIPRYLALACFVVVEISILHSPAIYIPVWYAAIITVWANLALILLGRFLFQTKKYIYRKRPYISYGFTLLLLMLMSLALQSYELKKQLLGMFVLFLFSGMAMLAFANSRRRDINKRIFLADRYNFRRRPLFFPVMLIILSVGAVVYVVTIFSVPFSRLVGPFNYFMLSFGVLVVTFNFVSWLSVRHRLNFHFVILFLVIIIGMFRDQYQISTLPAKTSFDKRISLDQYFENWYQKNELRLSDSSIQEIPIFCTLADGGASRSGYWVVQVLGVIQDQMGKGFSDNLFIVSGASGGSVGNVTYYALLDKEVNQQEEVSYKEEGSAFLEKDFLTFTISRMLNPIYFLNDRGAALEKSMAQAYPPMRRRFSEFMLTDADSVNMPILYITTTRMQDSYPGLLSNIQYEPEQLNRRLDVLDRLDELGKDIRLSTATVLSSRFPYMSPAGGIKKEYFVDGGYFDNSGAGVVHETLLAFEKFLKEKNPEYVHKVSFNILHIRNSKADDGNFERVNPFVNDLFAPILVLSASYGQQTEINTQRLKYYIENRSNADPLKNWHTVSLYKGEPGEQTYSMNWYMSKECRGRIDDRLNEVLEKERSLGHFLEVFQRK